VKREDRLHRRHSRFYGLILLVSAYCVAFIVGYGITQTIYRFTGRPPEILTHLFSGLSAIVLVMLIWRLAMRFGADPHRVDLQGFHDQLTETLAQIARGDFEILLDPGKVGVYNELAEAINDMARNLGTLETMRQDFISNVSHEIQSPLTSIGGFAALLKKDGLPDDERQRYAAIIEGESKRLSSLSDNLLKLSSLDNNPIIKSGFRLDKQLSSVILTLEPQWSAKNISLEADLQKFTVCGDEDLLSQIWVNLLHNAIKFTPENGQINIAMSANGDLAVVKISDTGVGIAPEDQIHIFERFYKADKARDRSLGGNGLGLSLVKKIVELHGGSVTVESTLGEGTMFETILPL